MDEWRTGARPRILGKVVAGPDPRPELIGRDEDLVALDAALEQARGGEPVTVLVAGEAGIGKTRLVEEFGERAFAAGARLLTGACVDLGDAAMPYGALMDALRGVPAEAFDALSDAARHALAALVPEAAPDGDTDPATQAELFAALLRLLEHVGRQEPLVLVIEDLHWADRSTQDLLKFLVRGLRQAAVLVVLTYRTDEMVRDHPVPQLLTELRRAPRAHARVLGGLTREQLGRHLDTMAGRAVDAGTLDAIAARSEGNPFFAEELLAAQDGAGPIPASVGDALLARLDRLPPTAQAVARVAAPLGHYVEHELLAAIADLPQSTLDQAVRACVTGHVLVVDEGGRGYRFRHALLQEVAACELLPGERARVHHRVAELLESRPAGRGTAEAQRLAEIAHHRLQSDDSATALGAALRAARAAERVHALAEASRNYDAALRLWDRVAEPETIAQVDLAEVLDRAAECRWLGTGDAGGSAELLERALTELGDAAPALRRADLTSRLAMTSWDAHANARAGLPLHEAALGMLDDAPSAIAARVRARFANTLLLLGDFPAAERRAADAVRTARAAGVLSEVADPLITLFVCRALEGDDAGTLALMEEARGPVLETADARIVKRFFTNAITSLHNFGRYEEALALSAEGIELHDRAGLDYHGKMCMHANAADALCALGRPRDAAALLGEAEGTVHVGHAAPPSRARPGRAARGPARGRRRASQADSRGARRGGDADPPRGHAGGRGRALARRLRHSAERSG
jgi:tetratricopeptide (TPR) repeat protein